MKTYAILENELVTNVIVWDGLSDYGVEGLVEIPDFSQAGIGWSYINEEFVDTRETILNP
jgi:hypothetical protein